MYRLRELDECDLTIVNKWRNNPALISFLGAPFRYINLEIDKKWYQNYLNKRNNCVRCSIIDENDAIIGLVSLTDIDTINRSAIFHIMIGDSNNYGKGIGSFATKEMLKHAFLNLNLHRVELLVLTTNTRAIAMYKKCGFVLEGTKRSCVYKNGEYVDLQMYSVLKPDFVYDD
jgi:UDP-4-amino-4,6-dideoxy-N-acetyl-beta-L-altrosamine N-acetyltransferase